MNFYEGQVVQLMNGYWGTVRLTAGNGSILKNRGMIYIEYPQFGESNWYWPHEIQELIEPNDIMKGLCSK